MKRLVLLVVLAIIAALAIWYGLRIAEQSSTVATTSLLPKDTLFLAHMADLNNARSQWHKTDLYKLWREPAVQDFLQKPLAKSPRYLGISQDLGQFEQLDPKDIFLALTAWKDDGPKAVAGFRFKGSVEDAEKLIEDWRGNLYKKFPDAKPEIVEYQQHQIQTMTAWRQLLATVRDGNWFFAANDLDELKRVLDRADHRIKENNATLAADEMFSAALKHMPSGYAALVYGRVDRYLEKISPLLAASGIIQSAGQAAPYQEIHSFCGALAFDGGKIRDTLFVAMPRLIDGEPLSRASLALGTKETFFYLASFLNLAQHTPWSLATQAKPGTSAILQAIVAALTGSGVTLEEWNSAFQREFGLLADWPTNARLPSFLISLLVKDAAKANNVLTKFTEPTTGLLWSEQQKNGVRFLSAQSTGQLFAFTPTVALSEHLLVAGTNPAAVEAAIQRRTGDSSELATSPTFRAAEQAVPTGKQAFFYIDSAMLYSRIDALLKPILLFGAALMRSPNENIDLSKWPDPAIVTKHLSPIVMSQNYQNDGYVTESIGPVTMYQAVIVCLSSAAAAMMGENQQNGTRTSGWKRAVPTASPVTVSPPYPPAPNKTP